MYSSRVLNAIADASREKRLSPKNAASGYQATQHLKNNLHNTRNKVISRYKRADAPQRLPRNHWRGPTAHSGNLGFNRKAPGCIVNPVFPIERPHQKLPVASCLINVRFWENQDQVPKTGHPPACHFQKATARNVRSRLHGLSGLFFAGAFHVQNSVKQCH